MHFQVHSTELEETCANVGMRKWTAAYVNRMKTSITELNAHVTEYMAEYDANETKRVSSAKKKQEADDEGY